MNINMLETHFNKLVGLCKKSKKEISGIMDTGVINNQIEIVDIKLDKKDMIENSSPKHINFNLKEYLISSIYDIAYIDKPVYIRFHTHPSSAGAPRLSEDDTETLKYLQSLTEKVKKIRTSDSIKIIEGIVTYSEIAFYTYDSETDQIIRVPFYVNGIEQIPSTEKTAFKAFKEGFLKGRSRIRK